MGRNRGRAQPVEKRTRGDLEQQERAALQRSPLVDRRQRPFVMVVYGLRAGPHLALRREAWDSDPNRTIPVTVFDISDGVRSWVAVPMAGPKVGKSPDGKIWFTPGNGVSMVDPRHLPFNNLPPPVHIEQVTADGKTYYQNLSSNGPSSRSILPPRVRDLSIDYSALSIVHRRKYAFDSSSRVRTRTGEGSSTSAEWSTRICRREVIGSA